ncbi:uncharacterized protein LOC120181045 [Hibiscus syriacus]|uniref:uncharacterized protein LOC120181045 n=1 Tax=Hibiscus syriacus TaxID=106335 RepID=UPI0019228384|nr:uncharacterized protein LOC120181045 [Hibiscus syriacus]
METKILRTFLVLILKITAADNMTQVRPIRLLNTSYKIFSKIIVHRLCSVLQRLIGPYQNSFLKGRSTSNNILIVQEAVHSMMNLKGRKGTVIAKIDLQKAYDNNGEITESLSPEQGLRQGDLLSPYLFILVMKRLSHIIMEKVDREADSNQMQYMKGCLDEFSRAAGVEVNLLKSKLFISPNISSSTAQYLSELCGIPLTDNLGTYLGVPIIHKRVNAGTYDSLIEKVMKRLAGWKGRVLTMAGRKTLIQSVTNAIPIHMMKTSVLPVSVCRKLDRLNCNFLWGGDIVNAHNHLVSWEKVCQSKKTGGLGIRKARLMNIALLAKNSWKLLTRQENLWCKVFEGKYLKK